MRVEAIGDARAADWDAYVVPRTGAITDVYAWRNVLKQAYGIESHLLVATGDDGAVSGALGLHEISHPLFGHYLTTAAFGNDGGFHFDDDRSRDYLVREARSLADRLDVQYLVIRSRNLELDGFTIGRDYFTAVVDLHEGAEALWKQLPAKTRNQVRRGQKEGFTIESGPSQVNAFFDVFHEHMRDLGSPAHSRKYYEEIASELGDRATFLVVRDGSTLAAGALLCYTNQTAMNLHTVALRRYNPRCANYLLYWRMMEMSAANGLHWLDMGRSRADSPQLRFKSNWNPQEIPLTYNYYLRRLKAVPDIDPRNPKYRLQIAAWQKMPLFMTKTVGPRLIAGLA